MQFSQTQSNGSRLAFRFVFITYGSLVALFCAMVLLMINYEQNNRETLFIVFALTPLAALLLHSGISGNRLSGYSASIYNAIISLAVIAVSPKNPTFYLYCVVGVFLSWFLLQVCIKGTVKSSKASQ